ncbi:MAG: hypothetical protein FWB72_01040 [Firmicutes bacterium]|nr:hypothetical protein [Bacillota bacterium]
MRIISICVAVVICLTAVAVAVPKESEYSAESKVSEILQPLTINNPRLVEPIWSDRPYDVVESYVYARGGRRLFHLRETGIVVTEDGIPVKNPADSSIVIYDEETESFVDGANRSLSIFLDSRVNRHYLRSGGRYVTPINLDRNVFMINLNARDGQRLIYAFRTRYDRGWLNGILGERFGYRFYDMNGRHINNNYIANFQRPAWWRQVLFGPVALTLTGNHLVPVVDILGKSTLRELTTLISHATTHPWATLECSIINRPVVTEDNRVVFVNPRTNQLTDFFGFALFNSVSGLPIVFHNGDIITTDLEQQRIDTIQAVGSNQPSAVLRQVTTVWALLESETEFYMASITTFFGQFDVPVFRTNVDAENPEWQLMNGECARDTINDMRPSEVLDGESFADWLRRVAPSGVNAVSTFGRIVALVLGIALLVLLIILALKVWAIIAPLRRF